MGTQTQVNRAIQKGITQGRMPPGCGYVKRMGGLLAKALEQELVDRGQVVGVYELALIQTCTRWEKFSLWAQREARTKADKLSPDQALAYQKAVAWGSHQRDLCLKALGLHKGVDPLSWLYGSKHPVIDVGGGNGEPAAGASPGSAATPSADGSPVGGDDGSEGHTGGDSDHQQRAVLESPGVGRAVPAGPPGPG